MIECLGGIIAITAVIFLLAMTRNSKSVVGKNVAPEAITECCYTYSSSTYPPDYQRYRFYMEAGAYKFYHEKREGIVWPLTEAHITRSGSIELSREEWTNFLSLLNGGIVKKRNQSAETGGSGPWIYLYWKNDGGEYQEFSFLMANGKKAFEEFCEKLVMVHGQ